VLLVAPINTSAQPKFNITEKIISGIVTDKNTKEVLIGATITNISEKKYFSTGKNGRFQFKTQKDSITIIVSFIGYESMLLKITDDSYLAIELNTITIQGEDVEITATTLQLHETNQLSSIRLTPIEMNKMPMQFGQRDILKAFQYYPGVQMGIEGSAGIHVRGGSIDQTEILLDGIPVFNPYHSGGFISTFHSSAIREVELLSAGFPALFGGRLGSFLDIKLKNGSKTDWHSELNIGLISADVFIEGPISPTISVIAAGRLNTFNNKLNLFDRNVQKVVPENSFWDGMLKLNWNINTNHQLNSIYFKSSDFESNGFNSSTKDSVMNQFASIKNHQVITTNWANESFGIQHIYNPNSIIYGKTSVYSTEYNYGTIQERENKLSTPTQLLSYNFFNYTTNSTINEKGFFSHWSVNHFEKEFSFGGGFKSLNLKNNISQQFQSNLSQLSSNIQFNPNATNNLYYIYSELEFNLIKRFLLKSGLRWNLYQTNETNYHFLNPRFSLRSLLTESSSIKASHSETDQFLHLLPNSGFSAQSDIWVASSKEIQPEQNSITAIGIYHTTMKWEFSTEIYYRKLKNIIEPTAGFDFFTNATPLSERISQGKGNVQGWESLFKKRVGKINGFVAYTLSKSIRQFQNINNGNSFPYKYDRRHNFTTNWNLELNKHFSFSATWTYLSGYYLTIPDVALITEYSNPYSSNSISITTFSERNNQKIADYHRLDISGTYHKKVSTYEFGLTAGAYNVYSRTNHAFWSVNPSIGYSNDSNSSAASKIGVDVFLLFPIQPFLSIYAKF